MTARLASPFANTAWSSISACFPAIVCSDKVWKWNCARAKRTPLSVNVPPTRGVATTVCPLFCKVNEVSFRDRTSGLSAGSTVAPTMLTGDCRARGVAPQAGLVSAQKPGPSSPEYEKLAPAAAAEGVPHTSHDTKITESKPIFGFIHSPCSRIGLTLTFDSGKPKPIRPSRLPWDRGPLRQRSSTPPQICASIKNSPALRDRHSNRLPLHSRILPIINPQQFQNRRRDILLMNQRSICRLAGSGRIRADKRNPDLLVPRNLFAVVVPVLHGAPAAVVACNHQRRVAPVFGRTLHPVPQTRKRTVQEPERVQDTIVPVAMRPVVTLIERNVYQLWMNGLQILERHLECERVVPRAVPRGQRVVLHSRDFAHPLRQARHLRIALPCIDEDRSRRVLADKLERLPGREQRHLFRREIPLLPHEFEKRGRRVLNIVVAIDAIVLCAAGQNFRISRKGKAIAIRHLHRAALVYITQRNASRHKCSPEERHKGLASFFWRRLP